VRKAKEPRPLVIHPREGRPHVVTACCSAWGCVPYEPPDEAESPDVDNMG
jgi:hypothetical protein